MRYFLILAPALIFLLFVFAGCSGDEESKENDMPSNPAEMVGDYLQDRVNIRQQTESDLGAIQVRKKVRNFWSINGRYPKNLAELEKATGPLPKPARGHKYSYNPANGEVSIIRGR